MGYPDFLLLNYLLGRSLTNNEMDESTLNHLLIVGGVLGGLLIVAPGLIWLERRLLALWQDRYGPNRAGPFGVFIVLADTIKLFFNYSLNFIILEIFPKLISLTKRHRIQIPNTNLQ